MKLALFQLPSPAGDLEAAFAAIERGLATAAGAGAGMAVFPELFLPGYNVERMEGLPLGGDWELRLADLARAAGCGLALGFAEAAEGRLYNSALALGADGFRLALYRKVQLYGTREKALFAPGARLSVFDLGGMKAALLICYDVEFAPHVRALAKEGVELILCPTANMQPFTHVTRLVVPTQAINHGVTIAYANYCGAERDLTYCGGSVIAAPDGAVLAEAGPGEATLIADISRAPDPAMLQTQLADYRKAEP
ncbi:MAG: carbon-nitrogen hydrolase family protein [Paracoccaceae bacterium]|nr:carbon-nitrogen hydrolase family protein [Paracoccaceae bacterium]